MEDFRVSTEYDGKRRRLFLITCKNCSVPMWCPKHAKRVFCSRSCAKTDPSCILEVECAQCGIPIKRRTKRIATTKSGLCFCNRTCKQKAQRIGGIAAIQPLHYGEGKGSYRDIAFAAHGKKCNRCGYNRYESVLRVHHINRDRANNTSENLEVLCPTCQEEEHLLSGDGLYTGMKRLPVLLVDPGNYDIPTFPVQTECSAI